MDAIEFFAEHGVDYVEAPAPSVTAGWVGILCPFCGGSKHKLGFNLKSRTFNCWGCGRRDAEEVVAALTNLSGQECEQVARSLRGGRRESAPRPKTPKRGTLVLPKGLGPLGRPHKRFLERRRLDPDEVQELWGVQGTRSAPRYQWSLFIPVTLDGKVVAFTTRPIADGRPGPKYDTARNDEVVLPAKSVLYGADFAEGAIAVTEGPLDAWAVGRGGCATLGLGYTQRQLAVMQSFPLRVIVFDAEPEAQRRARKLRDALELLPGETINVVLETGKDVSRASERERRKLRQLLR